MVQIAQARFGLVTIPVLQLQEMAPAQVLQNPSPAQLLPQDLPSRHKPNPVSIQIVIVSRKRPRLEHRAGPLPAAQASSWPISTDGTLSLEPVERTATRRFGPTTITAYESQAQHQVLLSSLQALLRLPQALPNPPKHRLGILRTARSGSRPKTAIPAGPLRMQMVLIRLCSTASMQYWARVVQTVGRKSGQPISIVWLLKKGILCKMQNVDCNFLNFVLDYVPRTL